LLGVVGEVVAPARQVVLVTPIGVAGGVGVVLEQVDDATDALVTQPCLGRPDETLQDPLAGLVVGYEVFDRVALGRGVLGMAPDIEVQTGAVFEEDVARPPPAHDASEQVPSDFVRAEAPLPAEGTRDAVFVLEPEYPPVHPVSP
jgi:hypothetical protein